MYVAAVCLLMALTAGSSQAAAPNEDPWAAYRFLLGKWIGEGEGQPGRTTGTATFKLDLNGRILVRTSSNAVPARGQQAAYTHEDLLVVYRDAPGQPVRAMYWDNEDHTIEYEVTASKDAKVTFTSKATPSATRFRLVYTQIDPARVEVKFEMAPPGNPEAFKMYLQSVTTRIESRE